MSARKRGSAGFTIVETLIVLILIAIVVSFVSPLIGRVLRREKVRSAVREIYSIVLAARMQAVKRNTQVIVKFDLPNHRVQSWADNLPYNYVNDVGEVLLADYQVPTYIFFNDAPNGAAVDGSSAVSFDQYAGNVTFVDMIVFRGDGSVLPPQGAFGNQPLRPGTLTAAVPNGSIDCEPGGHCRGVYMADNALTGTADNRNVFRISVDDFGGSGKASLLKWLPTSAGGNAGEVNYVPSPWHWAN